EATRRSRLRLIAAGDGRDGAVTIHQDADLWTALLEPGESVRHALQPGRHAWLHVARATVVAHGMRPPQGDRGANRDERAVDVKAIDRSEILLFDLGQIRRTLPKFQPKSARSRDGSFRICTRSAAKKTPQASTPISRHRDGRSSGGRSVRLTHSVCSDRATKLSAATFAPITMRRRGSANVMATHPATAKATSTA